MSHTFLPMSGVNGEAHRHHCLHEWFSYSWSLKCSHFSLTIIHKNCISSFNIATQTEWLQMQKWNNVLCSAYTCWRKRTDLKDHVIGKQEDFLVQAKILTCMPRCMIFIDRIMGSGLMDSIQHCLIRLSSVWMNLKTYFCFAKAKVTRLIDG